jgi:hypothetical protein
VAHCRRRRPHDDDKNHDEYLPLLCGFCGGRACHDRLQKSKCSSLGALKMGAGMGCTIRLAPDEQSLYINGWSAGGNIMGVSVPRQDDVRNGILRPGAFLVKLKVGK